MSEPSIFFFEVNERQGVFHRRAFLLGGFTGLGLLALLFLVRVAGQLAVALFAPGFLPPMELWYSGLVPYPVLLPLQVLILACQARVVASLWRGASRPGVARES